MSFLQFLQAYFTNDFEESLDWQVPRREVFTVYISLLSIFHACPLCDGGPGSEGRAT